MVAIRTVHEHSPNELLVRDTHIRISSVLPPGFKYLVDAFERIIEPAFLFLRKTCAPTGHLFSAASCSTYADHLYEWFALLEAADMPWHLATSKDIEAYSTTLYERVSLHTKKRLTARTRKARLRTIVSFYQYAQSEGFILNAPKMDLSEVPPDEQLTAGDFLEAKRSVSAIIVQPSEHAACITEGNLGRVFAALGILESSDTDDYIKSCRSRLAGELALHTGMRLEEVASVDKRRILGIAPGLSRNEPCGLYLTKTKRGNPRTVFLPSWLVLALQDYIDHERSFIVATAKKRDSDYIEPPQLFLNTVNANRRDYGQKLTRTRLMTVFRQAVEAANLMCKQVAFDAATGAQYLKHEPAYSFHNLRHTYAYTCYKAFIKEGKHHPWRLVQHLLGHKSLQTTLDTYLAGADLQEAAVSDALVETFHTWSELVNAAT